MHIELCKWTCSKGGGTWQLGKTGRHKELWLQRRRDVADGCKGLSSGSPLPIEFHSSSVIAKCLDSGPDPGGVRGKGSLSNPFSYK